MDRRNLSACCRSSKPWMSDLSWFSSMDLLLLILSCKRLRGGVLISGSNGLRKEASCGGDEDSVVDAIVEEG